LSEVKSLIGMINVNGISILKSSSTFFESLQIKLVASEASDSHISGLVG